MSGRRLDTMQWFGFLGAPVAWAVSLALGYFLAESHCEAARWRSGWSPTEIVLTAGAAAVAMGAEAAAAAVFFELRRVDRDAPGPDGRRYFFALGALVGNVLFFAAILVGGITVVVTQACRPA